MNDETTHSTEADSLETAREEIRERVENFRKQQAEMQATREARWDRVTADTRAKIRPIKE